MSIVTEYHTIKRNWTVNCVKLYGNNYINNNKKLDN